MKSIEEIVSMEENEKKLNNPVNFNSLNMYMHTTKTDEITKESLKYFFGDNIYCPNDDNEYLTHILARNAFRQGLTPGKTVKLFKIIYEMLNPNLPGGRYGKASITSLFTDTTTCTLTRHGLEFGLDFLKFIYRINIQNGFDINYTDGRRLHFINYVKLVDEYLSLIYEDNKISPEFSYLNYVKENLNNQEIIFNFQDIYVNHEIENLPIDDITSIFETEDFDYETEDFDFETEDFDYEKEFKYPNETTWTQPMKEEGQLYLLRLKKIRKEMENE